MNDWINSLRGLASALFMAAALFAGPVWHTLQAYSPAVPDGSAALAASPQSADPDWQWTAPGRVAAPILLYHRVGDRVGDSRYMVSVSDFQEQMRSLELWGYTPIRLSTLVDALTHGGYLPSRPVVITFDDGFLDVYRNAFPVLQRFGYPGVVYLVAGELDSPGFIGPAQVDALLSAGWEIGSHGMTHSALTRRDSRWEYEIGVSKELLRRRLRTGVSTFAYPYGLANPRIKTWVAGAGYQAAVGVGPSWVHTPRSLYFLSRIEVHGGFDLIDFARLLPWSDLFAIESLLGAHSGRLIFD